MTLTHVTVCLGRSIRITIRHFRVSYRLHPAGRLVAHSLPVFRVSNESQTLDDFLRGNKDVQKEVSLVFYLHHRDLIEDLHMQLFTEWETSPEKARLASNAIDAGFKVSVAILLSVLCYNMNLSRHCRSVQVKKSSRKWVLSSTSSGKPISKTSLTSPLCTSCTCAL
jgi:hypothetical protein